MKIVLLLIVLNLFSCVFSKHIRESGFLIHPKSILLVDNKNDCEELKIIKSSGHNWADNNEDKILSGILKLKAIAKENGYNAISDVQFQSAETPNGQAVGLICPTLKLNRFRELQIDEAWLRKQVKIGN